ncbi:hypothetical protein COU61_00480 [Candidatus Pacearchaeota archaeon CG10_big_fil_rev_8_21_14_0_10_35_13]|nr:MAG: hypothetical protein COU61_00480 [Candidatus Pacearchaeota archaeon CG10_big_fil_rev_8_21_14_0_10_35_13]
MARKEGSKFLIFVIFLSIITLAIITAEIITPTNIYLTEDTSAQINITINLTETNGNANITAINITLPTNFTFTSNTNKTTAGATNTFSNTSTVLTWNNTAGLVFNVTRQDFLFNVTAGTPGTWNITIITQNASGINQTNITITVNDTTAPHSLEFLSPTNTSGTNLSTNNMSINISASDNLAIDKIRVYLYYSNGTLANNTNTTTNPTSILFSGLNDGTYHINATTNDTSGNQNLTGTGTRIITVDTTAPTITLTRNSGTQNSLTVGISVGENNSGMGSSCTTNRGTTSGSGNTQTVTENALSCTNQYTYTVTCTDRAGNSGTTSATYSTDACSGGYSSGGITTSEWKKTYIVSEIATTEGYTKGLSVSERIKIYIKGEEHYVGIKKIDGEKITLKIESTPQEAVMSVGEIKNFDLNNDKKNDISITVKEVVNEIVSIEIKTIEEITNENINEGTSVEKNESSEEIIINEAEKNYWWIIAIILIIAAITGYFLRNRSKRKKRQKKNNSK